MKNKHFWSKPLRFGDRLLTHHSLAYRNSFYVCIWVGLHNIYKTNSHIHIYMHKHGFLKFSFSGVSGSLERKERFASVERLIRFLLFCQQTKLFLFYFLAQRGPFSIKLWTYISFDTPEQISYVYIPCCIVLMLIIHICIIFYSILLYSILFHSSL